MQGSLQLSVVVFPSIERSWNLTAVDEIVDLFFGHAGSFACPHCSFLLLSPIVNIQRISSIARLQSVFVRRMRLSMLTCVRKHQVDCYIVSIESHSLHLAKFLPRHLVVLPECIVDKLDTFKPQLAKLTGVRTAFRLVLLYCSLPFTLYFIVAQSAETNAPPFEDDNFDWRLPLAVASLPLTLRQTISGTTKGRLVV